MTRDGLRAITTNALAAALAVLGACSSRDAGPSSAVTLRVLN